MSECEILGETCHGCKENSKTGRVEGNRERLTRSGFAFEMRERANGSVWLERAQEG